MNPITVNPVIALDYARQVNAEDVRRADEYRLAAAFMEQRPHRRRRLRAVRPWWRRRLATA